MQSFVQRVLPWLAALVCVAYFSTLRDVPSWLAVPHPKVAPPLPKSIKDRDGELRVEVTDERGAMVPKAQITVLTIRDERAYLAGSYETDGAGVAVAHGVPRGETFVLAEGPGRQRASTKLVIAAGMATARLMLRRAHQLSVRITDEDQRPIAGASLEVRGGDPLPFVADTDTQGTAKIGRLGPSPWTLHVSAIGYEAATRTGLAESQFPTHVVLRALGTLMVHVIAGDGAPASQAKVTVAGSGLWPARSATTDAEGAVRIAALPAGAYDVAATKGDEVSETSIGTAIKKGETRELTLKLGPGRHIAVKVQTEGENGPSPIAKASVVLAEDGVTSFPREGVTGDDGMIVLGPIGTRSATVSARAPGFVGRAGVPVPTTLDGPLLVSLVRGGTLRGEVVDDRDFPVGGASIEIIGVDFSGMPIDETPETRAFHAAHFAWALPGPQALIPAGELGVMPGPLPHIPHAGEPIVPTDLLRPGGDDPAPEPWVTNADGLFAATPIPPGRVRALVRHPGYLEGLSSTVTLAPGGEAKVRVVLRPGATLEGRVLDPSGQPVSGARVEVAATQGPFVRSTVTADDGSFAFAAVPAEISVSIYRPDSFEDVALKKALMLKEGERHAEDFTLPEPRDPIAVRVVDDRGYPLEAAQVTALSLVPDSPLRATRFTGKDGVATLRDAAGISLRLEVSMPGHAPLRKTYEKAEREMSVTLGPGSVIAGEITTRGGHTVVEGADVNVYADAISRHAKTDDRGRYEMRDLPPGRAKVVVTKSGFARAEKAVDVAEGDGTHAVDVAAIDLEEAGSIEGTVLDKDGHAVVGALLALGTVPRHLPVGSLPAGVVVSDAHGRFTLLDVPTGESDFEAYAVDRGRKKARVKVYAGRATTEVEVTLDASDGDDDSAATGGVAITLGESGGAGKRVVSVVNVASGSEAERGGILVDDVLVVIDGHDVKSVAGAEKRLAGPVGDDVVVKVMRAGETVSLRVARERVRR